jgi:hypothetical protein
MFEIRMELHDLLPPAAAARAYLLPPAAARMSAGVVVEVARLEFQS